MILILNVQRLTAYSSFNTVYHSRDLAWAKCNMLLHSVCRSNLAQGAEGRDLISPVDDHWLMYHEPEASICSQWALPGGANWSLVAVLGDA